MKIEYIGGPLDGLSKRFEKPRKIVKYTRKKMESNCKAVYFLSFDKKFYIFQAYSTKE